MTALLTDEEVIEAARSHAQEETKLMHDSTERDEHLEYAERDFEAGARFARDHYEAALQRERECREKLVEALLEATDAIIAHDERPPGTYTACGMEFPILFDKINAALSAAKEME